MEQKERKGILSFLFLSSSGHYTTVYECLSSLYVYRTQHQISKIKGVFKIEESARPLRGEQAENMHGKPDEEKMHNFLSNARHAKYKEPSRVTYERITFFKCSYALMTK